MAVNVDMARFKGDYEKRQESKNYTTTDRFEVKDGENPFRLLPRSTQIFTDAGDYQFAWRFLVHYKLFKTKGFGALVCPRTYDMPCPICELRDRIDDDGVRKALRPAEQFVMNVMDIRDNKIKRLQGGPMIYDGLAVYWMDADTGPAHLLDFKEGLVLKVKKTPKEKSDTGYNKYDIIVAPKQFDVTPYLGEDWEAVLNSSERAYPVPKSYEELEVLADDYANSREPVTEVVPEEQKQKEAVVDAIAKRAAAVAPKMSKPVIPAAQSQVAAATTSTQPAASAETLECFGEAYQPKSQKCKECSMYIQCKRAFLAGA